MIFVLIPLTFYCIFTIKTSLEEDAIPEPTQTQTDIEEKLESNPDIYPFYTSLSEHYQNYYVKLCAAFEDYESTAFMERFEAESEMELAEDWLNENYREIVYEQPDYFWIDPNSFTFKEIQKGDKYTLNVDPNFTISEAEAEQRKRLYDERVNEIVGKAREKGNLFDAVLYVYDDILSKTDYDHELAEKEESALLGYSAYGCLVDGKTVCSGYTLAFTSIMQKLGLTCGAEFDEKADSETLNGHVWNYCRLGEDYYYFDLTWDDTSFDSDELKQYLDYTHDFFAVTEKELSVSQHFLKEKPTAPDCTAEKYNYYTYKNLYCGDYNFSRFREIAKRQSQGNYVVVKFSTVYQRERAEKSLFDNGRFFEIYPDIDGVKYIASSSGLQLYIFFD